MSDRDAFRDARDHGLKARHETREARAVRREIGEEIAQAIEARRDSQASLPLPELVMRGLKIYMTEAADLAREIGSRDPA